MIIGRDRKKVISNIARAAESGDFYAKVEMDDPVLTSEQTEEIVSNYLKNRNKLSFKFKSYIARKLANIATRLVNKGTVTEGLELIPEDIGGALITSNHFSPFENTVIRHMARKKGRRRLNIVSQTSNLAMKGIIGFLMNYADIIPISDSFHYLSGDFISTLDGLLKKDEFILIYPEQEMWFNYRKPRPLKKGVYYYSAKLNVPVISCFVEIKDLDDMDNDEFHKISYVLHVLGVLYPDSEKSINENCDELRSKDYELKKSAYERVYNKPLDYTFESSDIAGWTGSLEEDEAVNVENAE